MEKEAKEGRYFVFASVFLILGFSFFRFARSLYFYGSQQLTAQIFQVFINILLSTLLYKGSEVPRKLLGILAIFITVLELFVLLNVGYFSWKVLILGLTAFTNGTSGIVLLISKRVKKFMEYQRQGAE